MSVHWKGFLVTVSLLAMGGQLRPEACAAQDTTRRGVTIGITYDPTSKPGIAVLPVPGPYGDSVRAILQRDLDFSDRFVVVSLDATDQGAFRSAGVTGGLNYPFFGQLGALAVVQATPTVAGVHVTLHDVVKGAVANVGEFPLPKGGMGRDWRLGVHGVADELERWITGQRGISQTRIAYVRGATIRVVDSDGADDEGIPTAKNAFSPSWHPLGSMLVYATYGEQSRIMTYDLRTGRTHTLGVTPSNSNLTPVFSPDGSTIVYSHASEDGSDLFAVALAGGDARRISAGRGSDNTSPSFSPDGRRIAFTSGRAGHPEIYVMDADGTNPELLTSFDFGDQNYRSDPDWSPDGRLIAFQSQFAGRFQVMTINLRDQSTKLLTSEGANEQPSWAPDGRHLVLTSTRSGSKQLWVLDTESGRFRQLTHVLDARVAAWSPRLGVVPSP